MLSQRNLQVLIDLKSSLLAGEQETVAKGEEQAAERKPLELPPRDGKKEEKRKSHVMRGARSKAPQWQRYCQRGGRW